MAPLLPFVSLTARALGRKMRLASQVIRYSSLNPLTRSVIPASLVSESLDVIVGVGCSSVITVYRRNLLLSSHIIFEGVVIAIPLHVVNWLDNWPIGLKLNTELSKFCSQTFIVIITSWNYWLLRILDLALYGFSYLGLLGGSTLVGFAADVIQVTTLHLHMCHIIATMVAYGLRLSITTLWSLFQGKSYNQLCNRDDRWHYEMDHLVLGTIFFALAAFLMPTVLVYYVFFSCVEIFLHILFTAFNNTLLED